MHVFGLTGGIATGKSTVAARFRKRRLPVIDADELARVVVAPETDGLSAIVGAFGPRILRPDGALDRAALARVVFSDDQARRKLNAITHPRITRAMLERVEAFAARGEPLVCYEAALIVENGAAEQFRPLVVVTCPEALQLARIRARNPASDDDALGRIRAQAPMTEKIAAADYVIDTSGAVEASGLQADAALRAVCARVGVDAARYFPASTSS